MTRETSERTVLIVEDEAPLVRLITRLVEKAGARPLSATTGAEARRVFAEHESEIALALLDVTLPDGDGAEHLLADFVARKPVLEVVVMSGDELPPALSAELHRMGGRFLRKPFPPAELMRLVQTPASPSPAASAPPPGSA